MKMMLKLMSFEWKTQRWWFYSGAVLMAMLYFIRFDGFNAFKIPNDAMIRMKNSEVDLIIALTRVGDFSSYLCFPLFGFFVALLQMRQQPKADLYTFWRHRGCSSFELYGAKWALGLTYSLFVFIGYTLGKLYWVDFEAVKQFDIPLLAFGGIACPIIIGVLGYVFGAVCSLPSFKLVERILLALSGWLVLGRLYFWMFETYEMEAIIDIPFKEHPGVDTFVLLAISPIFFVLLYRVILWYRKTGLELALYPVVLFLTLSVSSWGWSLFGPERPLIEFDPLVDVNPKVIAFTNDGFPSFWEETLGLGRHIGINAITGKRVAPDQQSGISKFIRRKSVFQSSKLNVNRYTVKPIYMERSRARMRWFLVRQKGLFFLNGEEQRDRETYFGRNGFSKDPDSLQPFEGLEERHLLHRFKTLLITDRETLYANFETGEVVPLADWQPEAFGYIDGNIVIFNSQTIRLYRVDLGSLITYSTPGALKGAGVLRIDATPVGIGISLPMHPVNKFMENYGKQGFAALLSWDGQIRNEISFRVEMKKILNGRPRWISWTPFIALLPQFDWISLKRLEPFKTLRVTWPTMVAPQVFEKEMKVVYLLIALKHVFYAWLYLGFRVPLRRLKPSQRWYRGIGIMVLGFPFLISLWVVDKLDGLVSCPHCDEKRSRYSLECPYCKEDWPRPKAPKFDLNGNIQLNSQGGGPACG